jgi:hypothetical protein
LRSAHGGGARVLIITVEEIRPPETLALLTEVIEGADVAVIAGRGVDAADALTVDAQVAHGAGVSVVAGALDGDPHAAHAGLAARLDARTHGWADRRILA